LPYGPDGTPPDLAAVVAAWPTLPEPIRAGILALVRAAAPAPAVAPMALPPLAGTESQIP
jgi:hypothetical protein